MSSWLLLFFNFNALIFLLVALKPSHVLKGLDLPVFVHALTFTIEQAFISAACCVVIGLIAAPGFAHTGRFRRFLRWPLLLPNMMSPILTVLCLLLTFKSFPFGLGGIILGHVFINAGLCTIWLGDRWLELETRWKPVNDSVGGGAWYFYRKGILPQLLPQMRSTFVVVFSFCLASFAVPLVLGGGPQNSTLEVLIFERIHADADINSAVILGLVQCLVQFLGFVALLRPTLLKKEYSRVSGSLAMTPWIALTVGLVIFNLVPLVQLITMGFSQTALASLPTLEGFAMASMTSLIVGCSVAFITFFILALLSAWGWRASVLTAPTLSGVVVGLAGLLFFRSWTSESAVIVALVWGHLTVILLALFRLCAPNLEALRLKFEKVLRQLGASKTFGFKKVYFKLGLKIYVAGAILAGCWSFGEFSVARMVSGSHPTLPVFIQDLLGSYRLEQAAAAALVLLLLSIVSMTLFEVIGYGLG